MKGRPASWARAALIFLNMHAWTSYNPSYVDEVGTRDFTIQLALSLVSFPTALALVATALAAFAAQPIITTTVVPSPSPADVAALFAQQARGDGSVESLLCPCAAAQAPLAAVSSWTIPDEPFCTALRDATDSSPQPQSHYAICPEYNRTGKPLLHGQSIRSL